MLSEDLFTYTESIVKSLCRTIPKAVVNGMVQKAEVELLERGARAQHVGGRRRAGVARVADRAEAQPRQPGGCVGRVRGGGARGCRSPGAAGAPRGSPAMRSEVSSKSPARRR